MQKHVTRARLLTLEIAAPMPCPPKRIRRTLGMGATVGQGIWVRVTPTLRPVRTRSLLEVARAFTD